MSISSMSLTTTGRGTTAKGITLLYANILPVMAIVSLFPAIPKLFQQFGGIPNAQLLVPMIVTLPSLFLAFSAPFAGALADRFGRRRCFRSGMALYVAAGLVPLFTASIEIIVISRAVLGIAEAFVVTIASALIGDYFGETRHRWVAWVGITSSICGTLMIVAGGVLANVSWRGPFFIYLLAIPALIATLIFIDEPLEERPLGTTRRHAAYPWKQVRVIGGVTLVASLIYYVEPLHVAALLAQNGVTLPSAAGLYQAITTVTYVVGALIYRKLHQKTIGMLLGIAGGLMGIGQIVLGIATSVAAVNLGALIQQLGAGMVIPTLLAWGQMLLPIEQRGRGMGIWATAFFTGTFLCPPLVTGLQSLVGGLSSAMIVVGVTSILAALLALFLLRTRPIPPQYSGNE
ncbi:MFS transporter [Sphingomonas populi]|uniref:MFS transporter n=1 Tax=Sphingomonas populi TaxID=2484750 RepID=A0A4Q6XHX0_9SPHN|nr:MFS transporter [Sphingomonas populi]RZF59233.1 MFS transporter [Sphingomonas populi]